MKIQFVSEDGKVHSSKEECIEYEKQLHDKNAELENIKRDMIEEWDQAQEHYKKYVELHNRYSHKAYPEFYSWLKGVTE
jgi:multidrug resistance efflux pump